MSRKPGPRKPVSRKREIDVQQRRVQAIRLRACGRTYEEIARELGYSDRSSARRCVVAALKSDLHEAVEEMRALQGVRLDLVLNAFWDKAMAGDMGAARIVLRVIEQQCNLFGLFAATKVEVGVPRKEVTAAEIETLVEEIVELERTRQERERGPSRQTA